MSVCKEPAMRMNLYVLPLIRLDLCSFVDGTWKDTAGFVNSILFQI